MVFYYEGRSINIWKYLVLTERTYRQFKILLIVVFADLYVSNGIVRIVK
jgi:hypothetical protein